MPLQHTRLAHAEMNVLAQAIPADRLYEGILYTTLEPCAMCVWAAVVCGIRHIRYAAMDGSTGASGLLTAHPFLASKNVKLEGPEAALGAASLVLMTDWILREDSATAGRTLDAYRAQDARAVDLAQEWFRAGRLQAMAQAGVSSDALLAEITSALR
jgi:tRNA(Arg) A34 adenosine deaminase TadA